jgi:polyisoprenyl-teichoic acid--peptidoglycan teichoic acid transferase
VKGFRIDKGLILLALIFTVLGASSVYIFFQMRTDEWSQAADRGGVLGFLFVLTRDSDVLFSEVLLYNQKTHRGAVIDVPPNVGAIIESLKRVDRIDVLFASKDAGAYRDKIAVLTGQAVTFWAVLNLDNVEKLVDLLGGIDIFIANTNERDAAGKRILLPSGNVNLDGAKAATFLSYNDPDESEVDRIGRVQKFMQALLKRIGDEAAYLSREDVFGYFNSFIRSSIGDRAWRAFIKTMAELDSDRLIFQRVLGATRAVDNQELLFPHFEGQLLRQTVQQTAQNLESSETQAGREGSLSVEIMNATAVQGLARRTRDIYRSFGFEVISFRNAELEQPRTIIIDRKGSAESARKAADIIRCRRITTEIPTYAGKSPVDVTIILGKDFDGRYCKE